MKSLRGKLNANVVLAAVMLAMVSVFIMSACEDDEVTILSITSFTPLSGPVGTSVTITGTNFSSTLASNTVSFNGTSATISSASSTELVVAVPTGATTGKITVTAGGQSATSTDDFTVTTSTSTSLAITNFSPASGPVGTTVTVTGTNFSSTIANNTVTFNGTTATVTAAIPTQLTVTVPTGATTGKVAVTVGGTTVTSTTDFTVTTSSTADCSSATTQIEKLVCLANTFLATLTTTQQSSVVITLNLSNAKKWSNLPCALSCRNGLLFSGLTTAQQTAALAVIEAASGTVSNEGYEEFQAIRAADDYLGTKQSGYSAGNYVIAFLGTPSATGKWMLQFGGHHYAQNITYDNGQVTSITPLHEAVEPNGSFTVNGTTYSSPLTSELTAVRDMLAAFTTSELASAKISTTFSDCLMVPGSTTNTFPTTKQGIQVSNLSSTAQANVLAAIAAWVNDVDPSSAANYLTTYQNELANTYVTYSSNTSGTSGNASTFFTSNTDYVRIDGPSVWIEFVCQNGVVISNQVHYHTVMRDHNRDYIGL